MKSKSQLNAFSLYQVRRPSPHFQRAINLKYDLSDPDYLAGYIPTPNAVQAISTLLEAIRPTAKQRAMVLHGPYGSGKSLLGAVIAAIFSKDERLYSALQPLFGRLRRDFSQTAEFVDHHWAEGPRLLPIVLYGDEGPLASALSRALTKAMFDLDLGDHRPRTNYRAALETISMWQADYLDTYHQLGHFLETEGYNLAGLKDGLTYSQPDAYALFLRLYPKLTSGATFDNFYRQSIIDTYAETLRIVKEATPYEGLIILWDEFGRYLEGHAGEVFGPEVALLQDFTEYCNQEPGVILTLITHKVFGGYAWGLSGEIEKEWTRIAGRFQEVNISGDEQVSYRLMAEALMIVDESPWETYLATHQDAFTSLLRQVEEYQIFTALDTDQIRQWIIEGAFPLHPLAVYCLPRLSAQVAQNERTLFTFVASDETDALPSYLRRLNLEMSPTWIGLDGLFGYFAEAMKADISPGGVHTIWASADHALTKISEEDTLASRLIKSLAILQAVQKSQADLPTTNRLAFSVDENQEAVKQTLHYLARRKVILHAKATDSWELSIGSIIDIEEHIRSQLEKHPPTPLQLRRLLQDHLSLEPYPARRYNQRHRMVRFFHNWYRVPSELHSDGWDSILKQENYADGIIIYVLATNTDTLQQARTTIEAISNERIVFVLPREPLRVEEPLRELFALIELNNDLTFKAQDSRLEKELAFYIDDVKLRLVKMLAPLIDPAQVKADWYWQGQRWEKYTLNSIGRVTRFLSDVCEVVFSETPIFNNESFNVRRPSNQQVTAAEKVIDALLINPVDEQLGLTGYGPDWLIIKTMLTIPGFLRQVGEEGNWELGAPQDAKALQIWQIMQQFFEDARIEEKEFSTLINQLQWQPYGLRLGVLPLLLALALRQHLHVTTVRNNRRPVLPLDGATFTNLCQHPDHYTLELGPETPLQKAIWKLLEKHFGERVMPEERKHQPLRYLTLGMVRWLNSLPRFAQTTIKHLSKDAHRFRQLIAQALKDPTQVLFDDLPELLLGMDQPTGGIESSIDEGLMENRLLELMGELNAAYIDLKHRLDSFAISTFAKDAPKELWNGQSALSYWAKRLADQGEQPLTGFQFSEVVAQNLANVARNEIKAGNFWDTLTKEIVGTFPRDWDDQSEASFYETLSAAKERVEREFLALTDEVEDVVEVTIQTLVEDGKIVNYRLREVELSVQGQRILDNFKNVLSISGRPLSLNERRQIALKFLRHILSDNHE